MPGLHAAWITACVWSWPARGRLGSITLFCMQYRKSYGLGDTAAHWFTCCCYTVIQCVAVYCAVTIGIAHKERWAGGVRHSTEKCEPEAALCMQSSVAVPKCSKSGLSALPIQLIYYSIYGIINTINTWTLQRATQSSPVRKSWSCYWCVERGVIVYSRA